MGCSTHSVPSWSNVATRASLGTNFGLDASVVACTKAMIACFEAPSFHDGSGSAACAHPDVRKNGVERIGSAAKVATTVRRVIAIRRELVFICDPFHTWHCESEPGRWIRGLLSTVTPTDSESRP